MTQRTLHVSAQLSLPPDVVTATLIVYGGKGMGKTNFGSVLAEECDKAGIHYAIIDPMGVWWGLRHSPDGKGPGVEVLILGGIHGDIPIEPTGGAVCADLVVDEAANVIVDISRRPDGTMWSIAERVRFVRDYCKRLYQRQGEKRRPVLQCIDEAARFIPQVIRKDDSDVAACMGAIAVLVEEGRNVGIGVALITQRSARLNKDVAELADCMIAFRTVGPNSRRAVLDWLGEHVEKEKLKVYDAQLRSLPRGTALVVSPGWLEYEGVVATRMRQTFDSSATPKRGKQRRVSGGAKPDLTKYRQLMAATIEKAKAEDPKELKKRIRELEIALRDSSAKRLAAAPPPRVAEKVVTKTVTKIVKVPAITAIQVAQIRRAAETFARGGKQAAGAAAMMNTRLDRVAADLKYLDLSKHFGPPQQVPRIGKPRPFVVTDEAVRAARPRGPTKQQLATLAGGSPTLEPKLKAGARRMAAVLDTWHPQGLTKQQLATLAGVGRETGTFSEYIRALTERGIAIVQGDVVHLEAHDAGLWANGAQRPRNAREIATMYAGSLKAGARRMLDVLIDRGLDVEIHKNELAEATGVGRTTGTFSEYLRALTRNGLAEERGEGNNFVTVSPTLFMAGT
jgi:hypothetical protein